MLKKFAILALVLTNLIAGAWHFMDYVQTWNSDFIADDMVSHWDNRMAGLRADIPADVPIVGYVGDWDILPAEEYIYADTETEYVLTQYALAPVIVQRGDEPEWIIVNLTPKAYEMWIKTQPQNTIIVDYGKRIFLAHRP